VVRRYIQSFFGPERAPGLPRDARVGCVVLGCTHFPPFRGLIERELYELGGRGIPVVDSAEQTALDVKRFLDEREMKTDATGPGALTVLVTDMPASFDRVAARFLGVPLPEGAVQVDLGSGG
jgi:glutamate racemase